MTSDGTRSPSQPPIFWLGLAGLSVALIVLGVRLAASPNSAFGVGILIGLVIMLLVIAGFALSIAGRMRRTGNAFPDAIHMPIVVGPELAKAATALDDALPNVDLRLRPAMYATVAVDASGLHFVTDVVRAKASVEATAVTVAGLATTLSGSRTMGCIVIDVETPAGPISLPLIPMRLKNPLRTFKGDDLEKIAHDLRQAVTGGGLTPGWPY